MARIHIVIDDTLHRRAKAAAAMQGESLKAYLTQALELAVEKSEAKPAKPRKSS